MQKRRLLKLAAYLRTLRAPAFNMVRWGNGTPLKTPECGTVACAMGHAVHAKLFEGLTPASYDSFAPKYKRATHFEAASLLFNIPLNDARELFSAHWKYTTPKQVARRLENYVKTGVVPYVQ